MDSREQRERERLVHIYYGSWKGLYQRICEHYGRLSPPERFDWYFLDDDKYMSRLWETKEIRVERVCWTLTLDYLKARMWDEAKNLPYKMDNEELANIAYYYATNHLVNMGQSAEKLGEWLKNLAASERERIIKEEYERD